MNYLFAFFAVTITVFFQYALRHIITYNKDFAEDVNNASAMDRVMSVFNLTTMISVGITIVTAFSLIVSFHPVFSVLLYTVAICNYFHGAKKMKSIISRGAGD